MSQANNFGVNQDSIAAAPSDETADIKPSPLEETAQQQGLKVDRRYTLPRCASIRYNRVGTSKFGDL